jgi:hypothetical protein
VFQSTPATEALVDSLYLYLPVAEDPDGNLLTFTLLDGPAGMQVDPQTGRIEWTPTAGQRGIPLFPVPRLRVGLVWELQDYWDEPYNGYAGG